MEEECVCGNCNFCVTDDGPPYCVCKDLYTGVGLSQKCDEVDSFGRFMFARKKEDSVDNGRTYRNIHR